MTRIAQNLKFLPRLEGHTLRRSRPVITIWFALLLGSWGVPQSVGAEVLQVIRIVPGAAADQAGILPGDELTSLHMGDVTDTFSSALDLYLAENDKGSIKGVTLNGSRDGRATSWLVPSGRWGLSVAPKLVDAGENDALLSWLTSAGTENEVFEVLRAQWLETEQWGKLAWLAYQAVKLSSAADRWDEAKRTLQWSDEQVAQGLSSRTLAQLLVLMAESFEKQSDPVLARELYRRCIELLTPLNAHLSLANVLERLGGFDARRGQIEAATAYLDQAIQLLEAHAPTSLIAVRVWNGKGTAAYASGDYAAAVRHYERALALLEERGGPVDEMASPLGNLGTLAAIRGDLGKAQKLYDRALLIKQRNPDDPIIPRLLNNLGIIAKQRGDLLAAANYYQQALVINEARQSWVSYSTNLFNLADLASDQGDFASAAQLLTQALERFMEQNPKSPAVAQTLGELAGVELKLGNLNRAAELYQDAQALYREVARESVDYAFILQGLGDVAVQQKQFATAQDFYRKAIDWRRPVAPQSVHVASVLTGLGAVKQQIGDFASARGLLDEALSILGAVAPGSIAQAETLFALADLAAATGDIAASLENYESGISIVEYQTQRLGGADDSRSRFNDKYSHYFKDYIEQLIDARQAERAFDVLERYRARSLLAMLAERDLTWRQDLPPSLLRERRQLDRDYDDAQAHLQELAEGTPQPEALAAAREQLFDLKRQRDAFVARIRVSSPRFASISYPLPLSLDPVQQHLPQGTLALSFSVHEDRTLVFAVSSQGLTIVSVPVSASALGNQIERYRTLLGVGQFQPRVSDALVDLSQELYDQLLRPALANQSPERILVIPDGPLHLLPFAALIDSQVPSAVLDKSWRYLAEAMPVRSVLSLTLLRYLNEQSPQFESTATGLKLVGFGDPVLEGSTTAPPESQVRNARRIVSDLPALPGSRREIQSVVKLYEPDVRTYLGADATEARAKAVTGRVQYLHFATHSILNEQMPLDSGLVLSLPGADAAEGGNGLLQTWEIFEDLRVNSDLVVLSGCETGLGKAFGGEGLIGLTRAFHHAGGKAVMASLWQVADESAATIVTRFHEHRLKGHDAGQALRLAQLEFIEGAAPGWFAETWRSLTGRPEYGHPFHWAAFQLHGARL